MATNNDTRSLPMRRVNDAQDVRERLDHALLSTGSISSISDLLEQMMIEGDFEEPSEIAERWRTPAIQAHLIHAVHVLAHSAAVAVEGVIEHLEQPALERVA